ncbi:putative iron-sulfur protein [Sphingomonas paucimobilis]|nr:putative iron-sulfur protein [Sphingomonas paucimobilis]
MYPFTEGSFAVRNCWYVAAFSEEVGRDPLARTILDEPVALYRKENGDAVAVGGRCPHRHFPLGKSCLRGDDIVCGYHGIAFDANGRCVDIPSQNNIPRTYGIPAYPLVEHGVWLFIWMGDPERADPSQLPGLEEIGASGGGMLTRPFFVEQVAGRYQLLNDNLLDLTHLAHLHASTIGSPEMSTVEETLEKRPAHLRSHRHMKNTPAPPVLAANGLYSGTVDQIAGMDFYLPFLHAGIGDAFYPLDHPDHGGEPILRTRLFHAVTPETKKSCTYFFAMASTDHGILDQMKDYLKPVIGEDKFATEEIEKMLAVVGENPRELLIRTDRTAVEGRRMLQAMMDAEQSLVEER